MSAEILKKPGLAELAGAVEMFSRRFSVGDNVAINDFAGPVMKVIGYAKHPQSGDDKAVVCWFNVDGDLRDAALDERLLVQVTAEPDEPDEPGLFPDNDDK